MPHSSNKAFEKAFCHFRLQRMPEALAILDSQKGEAGLHERELRAQLVSQRASPLAM